MKKILFLILGLLFIQIASADTVNIDWSVDGQTYTQTSCTVGGDIILPTAPTKRGHTFLGWLAYTPIEYIEATGTQYIDTGIYGTLGTSYKIVAESSSSNGVSVLFGSRESATSKNIGSLIDATNHEIVVDFGDYSETRLIAGSNLDVHKVEIYNSRNYRYVYNLISGDKYENTLLYNTPFTSPLTLRIAGKSQGFSNEMINFKGKIYSCKIWNDNITLVRDFIPVLDKNGTPCMYDKVSDTFFYNAGTGNFIAGPVVTE